MIGSEVITFGVSFMLKAFQSHIANNQEIRKMEIELMQQNQRFQSEAQQDIRNRYTTGSLLGWTASLLALMGFFSIVVWPKMVAVFWPYINIVYAHEAVKSGFLFFTSATTNLKFTSVYGVVITPVDIHICAAIAGLYFGGFSVQRRK